MTIKVAVDVWLCRFNNVLFASIGHVDAGPEVLAGQYTSVHHALKAVQKKYTINMVGIAHPEMLGLV